MSAFELLIQQLVNGLSLGAIYALIALGYTMVYGIIELINFAHGDVFMVGSFVALLLAGSLGVSGAVAGPAVVIVMLAILLGTMLATGLLGVVIERAAYRPLRHAPRLAPLVTAIGVSFILENGMQLWQGADSKNYPSLLDQTTYSVGNVSISNIQILVMGSALVLMVALLLLVQRTRMGRAMR